MGEPEPSHHMTVPLGRGCFLVRPALPDRHDDTVPVLHGDGVHDDTPAIQAMIVGRPYRDAREPLTDRDHETLATLDPDRFTT